MEHSILVADDDDSIRFVLQKALQKEGYRIFTARTGQEAIDCLRVESVDAIFLDIFMDVNGLELMGTLREINKTASIIIITAHGTTQTAIEAAKRHAYDYLTKPFDLADIKSLAARAVYAAQQAKAAAREDSAKSTGKARPKDMAHQIAGESAAMHAVYLIIGRAAISDETVLIMGESGTGKELVARAIHQNSRRADREFVVVDCSAIPPNLIESALFGHVKGAFTGADASRQGKFEQADGGTIFLDEVGELPSEVQMKLLRVLQEREIEPIGSNKRRKVDVRVVAATNRRLDLAIQDGSFREDLFYRLNVIPIYLPPLRDRKEDVPDLVDLFITRFATDYNLPKTAISQEAFDLLMAYDWPGNVRELENTLKRALVMCSGQVLLPEHFPELSQKTRTLSTPAATSFEGRISALLREWVETYFEFNENYGSLQAEIRAAVEKPLFELILEKTDWNRSKAAEILGINRNTLHAKMEEYGIRGR
jgi:DNA-binding NtrC family response regulator